MEAELRRLLPPEVEFVTTRLWSARGSLRERLVEYLDRLDDYLGAFGGMPLDVFCFACTGSSYLAGYEHERAVLEGAAHRFGYPVLSATAALEAGLKRLGATRIAVVAPYPEWLLDAAERFWTDRAFEVVLSHRIVTRSAEDAHTIYGADRGGRPGRSPRLGRIDADALVLSGTGMPTLAALPEIRAVAGVPVLTSLTALAEEALRVVKEKVPDLFSGGK